MATRKTRRRRPSRRSRRRSPHRGDGILIRLLVPLSLLVVVGIVAFFILRPAATPSATPTTSACPQVADVVVGNISVPAGPIAGYCQPQLVNAATIMRASDAYTPDDRAKQIGVMVAIGESGLQNLTYGDSAGPDSRGIFQQRSNWGTLAQRMDPYTAAYNFYHRMFGVVGWNTLPPTVVAHTVQGNANPDYYTPYFPRAVVIVDDLLGDQLPPSFQLPVTPPPVALRP